MATEAAIAVANSQAYWIALTCARLSRAREIPMPEGKGKGRGPRPLRTEAEPWGIPEKKFLPPMKSREKALLRESNELVVTSFELCDVGNMANSIGNLEKPKRSILWNFKEAEKLEKGDPAWDAAVFDNCAMGGIRKKSQRVITRSPLLKDTLDGHVCRHTHHPEE